MEGERKSVKQQPLSSAQATEDAKCGRGLGFRQSLACCQRQGDLFEYKMSDVLMWE